MERIPFVQGAFEVYANTVLPYAAGSSALQHSVPGITPGTTDIGIFQVTTGADGVLFLDFRSLRSFLISGVEQLQPVVAEASARWSATGLAPAQTATLANVQYAVADLGL